MYVILKVFSTLVAFYVEGICLNWCYYQAKKLGGESIGHECWVTAGGC